jgi:hypothetical protein
MDEYGYKVKKLIEGKSALFTNAEKWDDGSPDMKGELLYKGRVLNPRSVDGSDIQTRGRSVSLGIDKHRRYKVWLRHQKKGKGVPFSADKKGNPESTRLSRAR